MSGKVKTIIACVAAIVLISALALCYAYFAPKGAEGDKTVTLTVFHGDGTEKGFEINTSSPNLRGALEQQKLISGDDSGVTLFVTTVDGEEADASLEQWWCLTKGGESIMTGVDDTMIADGEAYEFTLTTGYDF